ncbi:MAG: hypothetical protein J7L55_02610 [Desulfurococcales archaeon]|nr:hypothetical protein [Desulfurococcales archaeon]
MNKKAVYAALSLYVLIISVLPLINDLESINGWVAYGLGSYRYENNYFYIEVAGLGFSNSKPEISIRPIYLLSTYIPLISIDDSGSFCNALNLFRDMNYSVSRINSSALLMTYKGGDSNLYKYLVIFNRSTLSVIYRTEAPSNLSVLLELSYLAKVQSLRKEGDATIIDLRFKDPDNLYKEGRATLIITNASKLHVELGVRGIYRVLINAFNKEAIEIKLTHIFWPTDVTNDKLFQLSRWLNNERTIHLLYPFIAATLIYVGWRYWVKKES